MNKTYQIQVPPEHYSYNYDNKYRLISYWHQIIEIISLSPTNILEIGIGNGFVSKYLKQNNFDIKTLDVDQRLSPDFVGTVQNLPIKDKQFDLVACFEVVEHIPYDDVPKALSEIYRVGNKYVVLSVPDFYRRIRFFIDIPKIFTYKKVINLPRLITPEHIFDGEHYWELGKEGYSLNNFIKLVNETGFELIKTYRIFENPYHRIFILRV